MRTSDFDIQQSYDKQVALLMELRDCLSREHDNLINVDVEGLWKIIEEKEALLSNIKETQKELASHADPIHIAPEEKRDMVNRSSLSEDDSIKELRSKTTKLKKEIQIRAKENVQFVNETLGFFDELASVITKGARQESTYEGIKAKSGRSTPLIMRREV